MYFRSPCLSLTDLLGKAYTQHVVAANAALGRMSEQEAEALAAQKVDFFPEEAQAQSDALLDKVGQTLIPPFDNTMAGAPTESFRKAAHPHLSPLTGAGCCRIGEDGRLYFIGKSEHYHASRATGSLTSPVSSASSMRPTTTPAATSPALPRPASCSLPTASTGTTPQRPRRCCPRPRPTS